MAKFCIINPNDEKCYTYSRAHTRRIPLGQAYIAAALVNAGHDVTAIDATADDYSEDDVLKKVVDIQPDFVGIGGTTPLYSQMSSLSKKIKNEIEDVTVILGGPHVSSLPIPSLNTSSADFICIGEAEQSIVAVINCVENKTNPADIPGIAFKDGDEGHITTNYRLRLNQSKTETIKAVDLNICPIPARHLYDHSKYVDHARGFYESQTGAMFSRGCPGKCSFCGAADTLVRWRETSNIIEELKQVHAMGIPNLFVMDDTYTNQKKRILDLSQRITDSEIDLNISVQLRLDQVDREVCEAMYKSGVRYVGPGIESGSPRIMKAIGKGPFETRDHMREKIKLLQEYDWSIRCSYVFGMVGETEEDIMMTIDFAKELNATENAFSILTPYPDSPLWHTALARGQVDEYMDFDRFLYYNSVGCNLSDTPTDRLMELHKLAYTTVKNRSYTTSDELENAGLAGTLHTEKSNG